jgi:putative phosphoribosyl transferase
MIPIKHNTDLCQFIRVIGCYSFALNIGKMNFRYNNQVNIPADKNVTLEGELVIPFEANAIVIFSHGSGSSRFSPRNRMVADYLHRQQLGTLLFDLLTTQEDRIYQTRFNIELLTQRLVSATNWLTNYIPADGCRLGYFGASTGAASALKAAARIPEIGAVVSRGGRPDLAMDELHAVMAPVLFIVGSKDPDVLSLNEKAYWKINSPKKITVIEKATHLFEEPGTMEQVCIAAGDWFETYLQPVKTH